MQNVFKFPVLDLESRKWKSDPDNPNCPLNKFIGNKKAVKRLSRAAFSAMGNEFHDCSNYSFALCGPPSTGKTFLTKLFASTLGLPFVVIEPQMVKRVHDIFEEIEKEFLNFSSKQAKDDSLKLHNFGDNKYVVPPCIVFIDEVHNLKNSVVQGLLKATEPNDRLMITEESCSVNTKFICWMIATTDRGDLFDAFDTRFQKVNLELYSRKEMSQIVKMNNPDWTQEVCDLVAMYNSQVPREAISFAKDIRVEKEMTEDDWITVANRVAKDHGIDQFGLTNSRVEVLKVLGQTTMSASQLPFVIHVKEDELKKYIMPPLLAKTPDQSIPLVTVCTRGYSITPAGLAELDKRGISHRGFMAMPESVRSIFDKVA